jgi:hypothetical protein
MVQEDPLPSNCKSLVFRSSEPLRNRARFEVRGIPCIHDEAVGILHHAFQTLRQPVQRTKQLVRHQFKVVSYTGMHHTMRRKWQ